MAPYADKCQFPTEENPVCQRQHGLSTNNGTRKEKAMRTWQSRCYDNLLSSDLTGQVHMFPMLRSQVCRNIVGFNLAASDGAIVALIVRS